LELFCIIKSSVSLEVPYHWKFRIIGSVGGYAKMAALEKRAGGDSPWCVLSTSNDTELEKLKKLLNYHMCDINS
jgi:hypothetical protein